MQTDMNHFIILDINLQIKSRSYNGLVQSFLLIQEFQIEV